MAAGLVLFLSGTGFEWGRFQETFANLDLRWVGLSALLALSTYLGRALRWRVLIRGQKPDASVWKLFTATAIGFTAIVLFGRPGEMVRPYLIAKKEELSFSSQLAAWLLERIYDLMMALLIFGYALSQVKSSGVQVGERIQWVLGAGGYFVAFFGALCLVLFVSLRYFGERSIARITAGLGFLPERYQRKAAELIQAFGHGVGSAKDWTASASVLGYSVLEWILIGGCYYCLFRGSPDMARMGLTDVLIFLGFVAFGSVVQVPGIGGGMQLVAVVVLRELFGYGTEIAMGMAIVLWAITFVVIVPFGLLLAFFEGVRWSTLRHLDSPEAETGGSK